MVSTILVQGGKEARLVAVETFCLVCTLEMERWSACGPTIATFPKRVKCLFCYEFRVRAL